MSDGFLGYDMFIIETDAPFWDPLYIKGSFRETSRRLIFLFKSIILVKYQRYYF